MRKCLTVLPACGLVLLCACGKTPKVTDQPQDGVTGNYKAAVAAIDSGDYRTAYDLLTGADDEQSKELLSHFVFVPTTVTGRTDLSGTVYSGTTTLTYDADGNLLKVATPSEETAYTYADGRMTQEVNTREEHIETTTYTYDADGRLIRKHTVTDELQAEPPRQFIFTHTYTYDKNGNLIEERQSDETDTTVLTWHYNADGRETLQRIDHADGDWNKVETVYYADGTVHTVTARDAYRDEAFATEYDTQGRLWRQWILRDGEEPYKDQEYFYDGEGQLTKISYTDVGDTEHLYDENGRLTQKKSGGQHTAYTYDADGRCLTETLFIGDRFSQEKAFTYDAQGRVVQEVTTHANERTETSTYTFDAYGNVTARTYTGYDATLNNAPTAITKEVVWTPIYYPDGVADVVQDQLDLLQEPLDKY